MLRQHRRSGNKGLLWVRRDACVIRLDVHAGRTVGGTDHGRTRTWGEGSVVGQEEVDDKDERGEGDTEHKPLGVGGQAHDSHVRRKCSAPSTT